MIFAIKSSLKKTFNKTFKKNLINFYVFHNDYLSRNSKLLLNHVVSSNCANKIITLNYSKLLKS